MNILVTGGAGFIGSHVVDALLAKRHRVTVIDSLVSGKREFVSARAQFIKMDIRSSKIPSTFATLKPQALIHLAAQMDVRRSVRDPEEDAQININASLRLFATSAHLGVKKMIFACSGGAMYGDTNVIPTPETHSAVPDSPYGVSKLSAEHYLRLIARSKGIGWTSLRYGNVYGPRQNADGEAGVVAIFIKTILSGGTPTIFGSGNQTRDFVYVDDVVKANLLALASSRDGVFNIGTGKESSVREILSSIQSYCATRVRPRTAPSRLGEQRRSALAVTRAAKILRWKPTVVLNDGIAKTIEWFKRI